MPSFGMWGFDVVEGRGGEGRVGWGGGVMATRRECVNVSNEMLT